VDVVLSDGLAVYSVGTGEPLLLLPYPHASTLRPMAEDALAGLLAGMGRRVVTFDPPGAYRSSRPMRCDLTEMLACAEESLTVAGVPRPVDVVGHSMGALCSLALAVERPQSVRQLVLIGACSGFAAVRRWSTPHNWSPWRDAAWWKCLWWGTRQMTGTGSLAVHKRLDNLVEGASFVDPRHACYWTIEPGDERLPAPPRACWLRSARHVEYRHRLDGVRAPTLLLVGVADPQTPPVCTEELAAGIPNSHAVVLDASGHSPFVEQPQEVRQALATFLS
jgi:proline iminopeptidase